MNGGPGVSFLLSQLNYQGPAMLVYVVAGILALVFMSRAPIPSLLTLVGVGILIFTTVAMIGAQFYVVNNRTPQLSNMMSVIGIISSCARAVGLGFLVAAIFVGRNKVEVEDRYLHE